MRRTVLSTSPILAILGLGCMGVNVPGKADDLKHPIELEARCEGLAENFML